MPLKFRCFKHKKTRQVSYMPVGRYGNFLNTIKKIVNYVRYNIPQYYVVHLVLTLKEASTDIGFLSDNFHRVKEFIGMRLKRSGSDFKYIAVKEIQKERLEKYGEEAIHYHVLCIYSKPYVFPSPEEIAYSWRLGSVKITAPKIRMKVWKIVNYIGKYIGKGYEYDALELRKSFSASQIKQIYKLSPKRLEEVVSRFGKYRAESFRCTYRKIYEFTFHKLQEWVIDDGFLDVRERVKRFKKELVMEFPSEWDYKGICDSPF